MKRLIRKANDMNHSDKTIIEAFLNTFTDAFINCGDIDFIKEYNSLYTGSTPNKETQLSKLIVNEYLYLDNDLMLTFNQLESWGFELDETDEVVNDIKQVIENYDKYIDVQKPYLIANDIIQELIKKHI